MNQTLPNHQTYPWSETIDGRKVTFRLMTPEDRAVVQKFARTLTNADLMYLRNDITNPKVVDEWIYNIQANLTVTVLVKDNRKVIGYGSLHHNGLMWTKHLGELRILVEPDARHKGLGRRLAGEIFHVGKEMGLSRIFVQIAANQPRVRALFERMGFQPEATLRDWIMARDGSTHDLLIMSHAVNDFGS